jgi:hypothetical protein
MANIVMTSTTNSIKCDNGVYSGVSGALGVMQKKATFRKDEVFRLSLSPDESYVQVLFKSRANAQFLFSFNGATGTLQVDSIDGVSPSSNSDLYDKLIALIA